MSRVTVSEDKSTFCRDKKPFFYLADTIWSAFTNITEDEWIYYLKRRKEQGFNVLQINTMPQWDRCISDIGLYPFATADGHRFDFTRRIMSMRSECVNWRKRKDFSWRWWCSG